MKKMKLQNTVLSWCRNHGNKRRVSLLTCLSAAVLAFSPMLTGCDLETSSNGNLDGFWHMVQVDTLNTGGVKDMSKDLVFWSFQMKLLELSDHNDLNVIHMARFAHEGNALKVTQPCRYDLDLGNEMLTEEQLENIAKYGLNALEENFQVEHLNSSKMILSNGVLRLYFKKF